MATLTDVVPVTLMRRVCRFGGHGSDGAHCGLRRVGGGGGGAAAVFDSGAQRLDPARHGGAAPDGSPVVWPTACKFTALGRWLGLREPTASACANSDCAFCLLFVRVVGEFSEGLLRAMASCKNHAWPPTPSSCPGAVGLRSAARSLMMRCIISVGWRDDATAGQLRQPPPLPPCVPPTGRCAAGAPSTASLHEYSYTPVSSNIRVLSNNLQQHLLTRGCLKTARRLPRPLPPPAPARMARLRAEGVWQTTVAAHLLGSSSSTQRIKQSMHQLNQPLACRQSNRPSPGPHLSPAQASCPHPGSARQSPAAAAPRTGRMGGARGGRGLVIWVAAGSVAAGRIPATHLLCSVPHFACALLPGQTRFPPTCPPLSSQHAAPQQPTPTVSSVLMRRSSASDTEQ